MKKLIFIFAAAAAISFSTSSCKKCGHCEVGGVSSGTYCSKDNKAAYDAYKSSCEAQSSQGAKWVTE